ncbi:MAG: Mut7-C RNAse domain-containing protein [Desulfobacterales bacterium]|jgi:hypothetical protein
MVICFAADRTLGKLVKWLRILGFDTKFGFNVSTNRFNADLEENRIILTRTRAIKKQIRPHRLVFITSNHLDMQLRQVITEIGISLADTRPFSRCIRCNDPIVHVALKDVYGLIPDYIYESYNEFHKCLQCNRIFWPGSHTRRSLERIETLFD